MHQIHLSKIRISQNYPSVKEKEQEPSLLVMLVTYFGDYINH